MAIRAGFVNGSVTEMEPPVTRAILNLERRSWKFNATLKEFLPRLPSKKNALPENLKSVKGLDMSILKGWKPYHYTKRSEKLNDFMLARARAILNAEPGPGKSSWQKCSGVSH